MVADGRPNALMKYEFLRESSFRNAWPNADDAVLAAAAGFYLSPKNRDVTRCAFCGATLSSRLFHEAGAETPMRLHIRANPKCPFMMGVEVGNVPKRVQIWKYHHPHMKDLIRRIETFKNWTASWPMPVTMAEFGFFYTGPGYKVTCFACGNSIESWNYFDSPFERHYNKFSTQCPFIRSLKVYFASVSVTGSNTIVSKNFLECKICMDHHREVTYQPCGHMIACRECATKMSFCAVCRTPIVAVITTYL